MIAWLVTRADKTTVSLFARIAWRTVGAMCERVVTEQLDATRLKGLVNIGVDEISWRRHHRYLTLVSDHATSKIVWGAPGKNAATLDGFFTEIGPEKANIHREHEGHRGGQHGHGPGVREVRESQRP